MTPQAYKATKSNKKDVPLRFWYRQMLSKHVDALHSLMLELDKRDNVTTQTERYALLKLRDSLTEKIDANFPDPRKAAVA